MVYKYTNTKHKEKGAITLYLAVVFLFIIVGVSAGVNLLFFDQVKLVRSVGASTLAFHAAEAGAERILRLDACLILENEPNRLSCIVGASGVEDANIINECRGSALLSGSDEKECREGILELVSNSVRQLSNGTSYTYSIRDAGEDCEGNTTWGYCATATGLFGDTVRRIEIVR
jgi:hypothetical protein